MRRVVRATVCVLLASGLVWSVPPSRATVAIGAAGPARQSTTVVGDDDADAYRGDGGLLLPPSFSGTITMRNHVAECLGCIWRYTVYCAYGTDGLCQHAVATCPVGQIRYRVWFGRSLADTVVIGSVCWGRATPVTRRTLERTVADTVWRTLPVLRPVVQPRTGTLTSVPATFLTGQPATYRAPQARVAGLVVRITAYARWRWAWGDGVVEWVSVPGAPYPSTQLRHQYRRAGRFVATVRTHWSARYTVSGLGPFAALGDPVTQDGAVAVRVRASRVLLTPWS